MCGIVGLKYFNNQEIINENKFLFFLDSLKHRGPDGKGIYFNKDRNLSLGHHRLSIYDLDTRSNQPFEYLNKYIISFNGSIYNYIELKEELISQNYKFNTSSDTEVILAAYDRWGENAVKKFNGIWAFIIYDKEDDKIFVSRDRFGVKPIYYYKTDKIIAFASELKSFLYLYNFEKKINYKYISKTVEDIQTIEIIKETYLDNVFRLLPGENMFFDKHNKIYINKYWNLKKEIDGFNNKQINTSNISDQIEKLINASCKLRNRANVPLSVSLSGGLDSSIILNNLINLNNDKINLEIGATSSVTNDKEDSQLSGNYIVTHLRHTFTKSQELKHKIVMQIAKDSGKSDPLPTAGVSQGGNLGIDTNKTQSIDVSAGYSAGDSGGAVGPPPTSTSSTSTVSTTPMTDTATAGPR